MSWIPNIGDYVIVFSWDGINNRAEKYIAEYKGKESSQGFTFFKVRMQGTPVQKLVGSQCIFPMTMETALQTWEDDRIALAKQLKEMDGRMYQLLNKRSEY